MHTKLRTIIVEDEEKDRKVIEHILQQYYPDQVELGGSADDIEAGIQLIKEEKPDLVLLDIVLHGNKYGAFQLLESVEHNFQIIFITGQNSSEYYIRALRLNCIDYISKPTSIEDFEEPLKKALEEKTKQEERRKLDKYVERLELLIEMMKQKKKPEHIALPIEYGHVIVDIDDIIMCQSNGNYTDFIFTNNTKRVITGNLKCYEDLFSGFTFVRVHKQVMINLKHIKEFSKKEGGKVILSNNETVYIGEHWKQDFMKKYCDFVGNPMIKG